MIELNFESITIPNNVTLNTIYKDSMPFYSNLIERSPPMSEPINTDKPLYKFNPKLTLDPKLNTNYS